MADVATPSAATMSTMDAGADNQVKTHKPKPEKPDEGTFKEAVRVAEQVHAKAQEKFVCNPLNGFLPKMYAMAFCH